MTIQKPLVRSFDDTAWDQAAREVNSWRGQAIQIFAQAELAVTETLEHLGSHPSRGLKIRLRHLVGQRFEDLNGVLTEEFAGEGKKAAEALENFRRHEHLRPALCHGVAKLALDRNGHWLVILKVVAFRGRTVERTAESFEQRDAESLLEALRRDARRLTSALQSLRSRLDPPFPR